MTMDTDQTSDNLPALRPGLTQARPLPRSVLSGHHGIAAIDFGTSSSTVTVYDNASPAPYPLPALQSAVLREKLCALLLRRPQDGETFGGRVSGHVHLWIQLLRFVARDVLKEPNPAPERLAEAVRAERSDGAPLLHAVLGGLDAGVTSLPEPLGAWLAFQLHRCYDAAFSAVCLDSRSLHMVELNVHRDRELPSRLEVLRLDPLTVRLAEESSGASYDDDDVFVTQSLKHHLMASRPEIIGEHHFATTDGLLAAAIGFLLERTDQFIANPDHGFDTRPMNNIVLTYPTMAPPMVRQRMREIAEDLLGVSTVDLRYDEAVAAALYFLMRDLGADYAIGIEALRARMRRVRHEHPDRPARDDRPRWEENVLVIDVGGGTTDIAMMTFELCDDTRPGAGGGSGRRYRISPRLLGTSGRTRRGGDFITLQVFHWIKAILADHLLCGTADRPAMSASGRTAWQSWRAGLLAQLSPEFQTHGGADYAPGSLVTHMLAELKESTGGVRRRVTKVRDLINDVLPTRSAGTSRLTPAANLLWQLAEEMKKALGQAETDLGLAADATQSIVEKALPRSLAEHVPSLFPEPVTLRRDHFAEIAKPVLEEITALATGLARQQCEQETTRLDRVILTGKASQLPLAYRIVREGFRRGHGLGTGSDRWRTDEVALERDHPKHATSIGAAWAASLDAFETERDDAPADGETTVRVDNDNLFLRLPCGFSRNAGNDNGKPLLRAGELFRDLGDGELRVRSAAEPIRQSFILHRLVEGGSPQMWGSVRYHELLQEQHRVDPSFQPDPQVWKDEVQVMIETDPGLNVWVLMWRGEQPDLRIHNVRDQIDLAALLSRKGIDVPDDDAGLAALVELRGADHEAVSFGGDRADIRTLVQPDGGSGAGLISGVLPRPAAGGWPVLVRHDGTDHPVGALSPGVRPEQFADHVVSLDRHGILRLHRGQLPLHRAEHVADVQEHPGRVFCHQLTGAVVDESPLDNPFSGIH